MSNCCLNSVPQSDSRFETFAAPVADWAARLTAGLTRSVRVRGQTLGHMEEEILQQTRGLERKLLEEAAQKKADQSPPVCPVWAPADAPNPGSGTHLSDPFRAGDDPAAAGLVPALLGMAISRGSCLGLERGRQRLARGARDGGLGRQQNAAGRSQRGHRAADWGQTAACDLGSGGSSPRPTGGAQARPTGRTNAPSHRR